MKARVKATGDIVEVSQGIYYPYQYVNNNGTIYTEEHLEILQEVLDSTIDYWARLEHQAAIAAMQGILSNPAFPKHSQEGYYKKNVVNNAYEYAHALVEKFKKEEK